MKSRSSKFKEISEKLRLALLGLETPEETRTREALLKSTTSKAHATKSLRDLNAAVLRPHATTREEREAEARRLAAASRPHIPDARVMFVQHTHCLTCSHQSEGMSHPHIFLRLRKVISGHFTSDIRYVLQASFGESIPPHLPRIIEHFFERVKVCPKCFTNAVHSFSGENIESLSGAPTSSASESESSPLQGRSASVLEGKSSTPTSPSPVKEENTSSPKKSDSTSSAPGEAPAPASSSPSLIATSLDAIPLSSLATIEPPSAEPRTRENEA